MPRNKILYLSHPDGGTLSFWWETADGVRAENCEFSRALGRTGRSMRRRSPPAGDLPMLGRSVDQ
jgi:hypothetical protein